MKMLFTNIYLVTAIGLMSVTISLALSAYSGDWLRFSSAGAIMTICGVILTIRAIIRLGPKKWKKEQNIIDGGSFVPNAEEIEANRQSDLDNTASLIGFVLVILGTIIWGYGDLVGGFFK
jgi:drug/metabolite transporter (DMT)-like permease